MAGVKPPFRLTSDPGKAVLTLHPAWSTWHNGLKKEHVRTTGETERGQSHQLKSAAPRVSGRQYLMSWADAFGQASGSNGPSRSAFE